MLGQEKLMKQLVYLQETVAAEPHAVAVELQKAPLLKLL
jgi:hypothetical protein